MNGKIFPADFQGLEEASHRLREGKVIAFPTETFYGLGVDAFNAEALRKIFEIKGRKEKNPLLILIGEPSWLPGLVKKIPPLAESLMGRFWPGPLTLILDARSSIPSFVTGGTGKVGIRISSHPVAQALVQRVGRAITGTSANRSGEPGTRTAAAVGAVLGSSLDGILDGGRTRGGLGSTVLDVSGDAPIFIREGAVSRDALAPFL
jgi:L-threonylcarbamoyladenylate synthase